MAFRMAGALLALCTVGTACGSTLSDKELNAQAAETFNASFDRSADPSDATPGDSTAADAGRGSTTDAEVSGGAGTASPGGPAAGNAATPAGTGSAAGTVDRGAASAGAAKTGAAGSSSAATPGRPVGSRANEPAPTRAGTPVPGQPGTPGPVAPGGPKSEIVIGSFGVESGVVGAIMLPVAQAARVWATDINARGGLNGHPVRLIVADDEGDPNKAASIVTRMIEQDKVVAFLGEHAPTTIQAVLPILEKRRVPILGGCNCSPLTAHSPMTFQIGTGSEWGLVWAHSLQLTAFSDKKKISVFACREVQVCENVRVKMADAAKVLGLHIVHQAQVTLAQPDYTAEVLAARNAGAEAIVAAIDNTAAVRMARSAHRQGYHPVISIQYSGMDDRTTQAGGDELEGALIGGGMPYWGSPKMADYKAAMGRYAPGGIKASIGMNVWGAGKLMEKISAGFPDSGVTSEDFLRGLYSLKDETLGGLIPPLTYREGKGTENECIIPIKFQNNTFVAPNGDTWLCPPVRKSD
ncbi:MAG: ABC transporter substrate-binding protein [Actinomycetota bacterium]